MAQAGTTQAVVVVVHLVLPAGVDADVGDKSTAADADADEAGRWVKDDIPFGTLEEHSRMEPQQPLFLLSFWPWMASSTMIAMPSTMMVLLTNFGKVPTLLRSRHSCSFMESLYFFFLSVSTCSKAYYARWLNNIALGSKGL
jgi:hypothetical protein